MILVLPWPPSINVYKMHDRRGFTYLSKRAKDFRRDVEAVVVSEGKNQRLASELFAFVDLFPTRNGQYDIDNFLKPLLDSLMHAGVMIDDSQIQGMLVRKHEKDGKGGRVIVRLEGFEKVKESLAEFDPTRAG